MTNAMWMEIRCEFLSRLRMPRYSVSILAFPLMFYLFFGVILQNGKLGGVGPAVYMLCTMASFGVMFAPLMGLGAGIASERGLGWMEVKRASPMPPVGWFLAKFCGGMAFSAIIVAALFVMGATLGSVRMPVAQWAALGGALIVGSIPFCVLGFVLGYLVTANSAPAMINLVAMPMAFCSGLWVPVQFLPHAIQNIAGFMPAYHVAELSQALAGASGHGSVASHVQALAGLTIVFVAAARMVWRRDQGRVHAG